MNSQKISELQSRIQAAAQAGQSLRIVGQGSKSSLMSKGFEGEVLSTKDLSGVLDYQPTELMLRVGAGTPLTEINLTLTKAGQCLPCDALMLQGRGTAGGALATGLSGARRVAFGQIRDFVLGVNIIDGRGHHLRFGGQVIKNVAGYDVSRMMSGSWGQFACFTEISFRTLPLPRADQTLIFDNASVHSTIAAIQQAVSAALPISSSVIHEDRVWVRLSGNHASVTQGIQTLTQSLGTAKFLEREEASLFWQSLQSFSAPCFNPLDSVGQWWRIAVPPLSPMKFQHPQLQSLMPQVIEWHGSLRWFWSKLSSEAWQALQQEVLSLRGAVMAWSHTNQQHPATSPYPITMAMDEKTQTMHASIKAVFDPAGIWV